MHNALAAILLIVGVIVGVIVAVARPWRLPAWALPLAAALIALPTRNVHLRSGSTRARAW